MGSVPATARAYILCALLCAVACALPALWQENRVGWCVVALLALLYAGCEMPSRRRCPGPALPVNAGSFFPVLLAAAFLLPPAAAALVAVPGAALGPVAGGPAAVRRVWRAAQLALATWSAATADALLGGRTALDGQHSPHFPFALLPAAAAAVTFCLVLTVLEAGILAAAERQPAPTAWRGLVLRSLVPHLVHGLAGLMMAVLWTSPYGPVSALFVLLPMYISCWLFQQYHRERSAHQATIRALVQAVDLKDRYTRGHSERVGRASVLIARELNWDERRVEVIRFAGILHDVGKLGVPTRVLRKEGPLTDDERRVIQLHPEYGHEIVRGIGFLGEARSAILHHHERMDGTGYPCGLAGERIPEFARVVAVADAFDAMTSTRSYSRARPVPVALAELRRCAGSHFDPRMVEALVRALERHGWESEVTADDPTGQQPPKPRAGPADGRVEGPGGAIPAQSARVAGRTRTPGGPA
ncbi:HD-GYP domain-containing protein [Streptomyces clavuligerus]|uniref:Putative integral membrane protein n=1 Tax=Streptomyces clavuligerus TaxID=1901 RepID=B5GQB5_STRCL|nr:HD-GYP domain-containing protein [Streptomyces clavuligerus]ANW18233.1 metal-dependent phosphohydrolase [Streptomyces clavuligerus]AXU12795.1 HD-GYP domain-containing protein [Streptomyces clavuligerus]EDY48511.1 integral membrane protein [Streptomyces clavuligerus]EFG09159.1 Putative integral membrane protein [Streptomyces clavuligerus]MBY6302707.1 HD-GYP domain-containing protein [Streptomyces clavuligerus]